MRLPLPLLLIASLSSHLVGIGGANALKFDADYVNQLRQDAEDAAKALQSPVIEAKIESPWPDPPFVIQFLESVALEAPTKLIPFMFYLTSLPRVGTESLPVDLDTFNGSSPAFSPFLLPRDASKYLFARLAKSFVLRRLEEKESMSVNLANKESLPLIQTFFMLEKERAKELEDLRECETWIDIDGKKVCSAEEFWDFVGHDQKNTKTHAPLVLPSRSGPSSAFHPFDHIWPERDPVGGVPTLTLYTSAVTHDLADLFPILYTLAVPSIPYDPLNTDAMWRWAPRDNKPRIRFAVRWKEASVDTVESKANKGENAVLSGWGAGLDIKKSDYLAIDDRNVVDGEEKVPSGQSPKMVPVKKGDMQDLGLRATASLVYPKMSIYSTVVQLVNLTSSFPLWASSLATQVPDIPQELRQEISTNQMTHAVSSRNGFYVNGLSLTPEEVATFPLLRIMRRERKWVTDIYRSAYASLKTISMNDARNVLTFEEYGRASSAALGGVGKDGRVTVEGLGEIFDASDRLEGGGVVLWWNDLEKDQKYESWSKDLKDLLRPTYPGQMNLLSRNLNNIVLVLDLSRPESLQLLSESVRTYVSRGIPVRFGVVPKLKFGDAEDLSAKVAKVIWYSTEKLGRAKAMSLMSDLVDASKGASAVSEAGLKSVYDSYVQASDSTDLATYEEIQSDFGLEEKTRIGKATAYNQRLGLGVSSSKNGASKALGDFFLNGVYAVIDEDFTQKLQKTLGLHTQFLQQEVYLGQLTDKKNVNTYFYNLKTVNKRRNAYVYPPDTNPLKFVNMLDAIQNLPAEWMNSFTEGVTPSDEAEPADPPIVQSTILVVADLNSAEGRDLARSVLTMLDARPTAQVTFVHNPTKLEITSHPHAFSDVLATLLDRNTLVDGLPIEWVSWLDLNLDSSGPGELDPKVWSAENPLFSLVKEGTTAAEREKSLEWWQTLQELRENLSFLPGERGLIVNGRVIGPLDESFSSADASTLVDYELAKRTMPVIRALESLARNPLKGADLHRPDGARYIMTLTSIVACAYQPDAAAGIFGTKVVERVRDYRLLDANFSSVIGVNEELAPLEIGVVLDPVSEIAQKWAPILLTLLNLKTINLRIHFSPSQFLTELPIKRFYQYNFPVDTYFDPDTGTVLRSSTSFEDIPEDTLLTFAADLPNSWLAFPKSTVHDLDNIRLADLPAGARAAGIKAVLELENIVVEGHAREMPAGQPPRGLQLELLSGAADTASSKVDTIVMSNLGYFQFKANPGLWRLGVRDGKSASVFELESAGASGWKSGGVAENGNLLTVTTFEGLTIYPRFERRKGQEFVELLDEGGAAPAAANQDGLLGRVKSMFPFIAPYLPSALTTGTKKAEINIFTVASGLLYERMAFLMMLSVMKHTESTVKFWFIQNFLSPSFKAFIPHMAKEYGFEYELVTYKWPHWLRSQKEKQRTIWGYKILFLDVLFPLELDRVIFVDSDQIVRADLKELVNLDLKGAPYAYAPMGDDREEMEGFRFWKTGYWKEHLKDRPYHISALYVVDLDRFRQIAAGDRLRQQYQGLSADPNSLSNLDQDLPNNMQASLPIYTLDKSWLWCETWCSDESLAEAKTIDLCNNPLTHEPKLARAKRLIPEWTTYDDEVARLAQRVASDAAVEGADNIGAFSKKADELRQAVEQSVERDEFAGGQVETDPVLGERIKDEL